MQYRLQFSDDQYFPCLPVHAKRVGCRLISQCWAHDPDERPEFSEILDKLEEMVKPLGDGKSKGGAEGKPKCCTIL